MMEYSMLFAEHAGFWDWAIKFMEPGTLTQVGLILGLILKHVRDEWNNSTTKGEVTAGNKIAEAVFPAVADKIDSATLHQDQLKQETEQLAGKAAIQTAVVLGEQLKGQAKAAAVHVAQAALIASDKLAATVVEQVQKVEKAVKGEDGKCLTGRIGKLEDRMGGVETGLGDLKDMVGELKDLVSQRRTGDTTKNAFVA